MKRGGYLSRRTPLAKKGKSDTAKLKRQLWELCKAITRKRHGNVCYTCGQCPLEGSNWHTGHMWPEASLGADMKHELQILRPQCYRCNIHYGGMGAAFFARMLSEIGKRKMATLEKRRQESKSGNTKADSLFYEKKIKAYGRTLLKLGEIEWADQ